MNDNYRSNIISGIVIGIILSMGFIEFFGPESVIGLFFVFLFLDIIL